MGSKKDDFPLEWLAGDPPKKPVPPPIAKNRNAGVGKLDVKSVEWKKVLTDLEKAENDLQIKSSEFHSIDFDPTPPTKSPATQNQRIPGSWLDEANLEYRPEIPKTSTWVKVTGVTKYQSSFAAILGKNYGLPLEATYKATLQAEPTNRFDCDAVQVFVGSHLIGYVERDATWRFRRAAAAGLVTDGKLETTVQIVGDEEFTDKNQIIYWAKVDLSPPQKINTSTQTSKPQNLFTKPIVIPRQVLELIPTLLALALMLWVIRGCTNFLSSLPKTPIVKFDSKNGTNDGGISSKSSFPKYEGIAASKSLLKKMTDYKLTFPWETPTVEDTGVEMRIVRGTVTAGPYEWRWHVTWQWQTTEWRPTAGSLGPYSRQFAPTKY